MSLIKPFAIERYFAKYEFNTRYLLSCSDCEPYAMTDVLSMANPDTRRLWDDLTLSYTESPGHPLLREVIAETYAGVGKDDVVVLAPEEGIFVLMNILLSPGDHVICTFPGYQSLYEIARSIGCELSFWKADEKQGWNFHVRDLEELIRDNTRLVIANFPHNPTGFVPTSEQFFEMINVVKASKAYLFSDEMYRCLEFGKRPTLPSACTQYEKAVSLSGLSKAYGLPGLRIGWLASSQKDLMARITAFKDYTTICNSAPGEILAIVALMNREQILNDQIERVRRNAGVLNKFVANYNEFFQLNPAQAGSICFPRLTKHPDTTTFCTELVQNAGIMLVPSSVFDFGHHHIRIGFGRENFPEVIERFGRYVTK